MALMNFENQKTAFVHKDTTVRIIKIKDKGYKIYA